MHKRIAAFVAALALVLTGLTASPAQADGDMIWTAKPMGAYAPGISVDPHDAPPNRFPGQEHERTAQRSALAPPPADSYVYYWVGAYQIRPTPDILGATVGMHRAGAMYKSPVEYHTHNQISVEASSVTTPGKRNMVEIGYGIGLYCGQVTTPCLWGHIWVDGIAKGYCAANCPASTGFVPYAGSTVQLGQTVPVSPLGCSYRVGVRKNDTTGHWMLWVNTCYKTGNTAGTWVGHFKKEMWTDAGEDFTGGRVFQVFNEVATHYNPDVNPAQDGLPCSDAGSPGTLASSTSGTGQRFADVTLAPHPNSAVNLAIDANGSAASSHPDTNDNTFGRYEVHALDGQPVGNVRYVNAGGPGYEATNGGDGIGVVAGC